MPESSKASRPNSHMSVADANRFEVIRRCVICPSWIVEEREDGWWICLTSGYDSPYWAGPFESDEVACHTIGTNLLEDVRRKFINMKNSAS